MYKYSIPLGMILVAVTFPAHAQMANTPWGFQPQNRASIAALMRQVENPTPPATNNITSLVCGGGAGQATAQGNSSCVILNNTAAQLNVDQEDNGTQTATGTTTQTTTSTDSGADEVLAALGAK